MKPLTSSPFVRYLGYSAEKVGYWKYEHMVVQIKDAIDFLKHLYPQFDFEFELDQSSGHNKEQPNGLSTSGTTLNSGRGGAQREMRSSVLEKGNVGTLEHNRQIKIGEEQKMVFQEGYLPPIFNPTAPKYDTTSSCYPRVKLSAKELKVLLEANKFKNTGGFKALQRRAKEKRLCIDKLNIVQIKKNGIKKGVRKGRKKQQ